jgi:hypothetical protein
MADKQKLMPKMIPKGKPAPFDPNKTNPYSTDKEFAMDEDLKPGQTERDAQRQEQQIYMAPSKRENPVRSYCKGGKVISKRSM